MSDPKPVRRLSASRLNLLNDCHEDVSSEMGYMKDHTGTVYICIL